MSNLQTTAVHEQKPKRRELIDVPKTLELNDDHGQGTYTLVRGLTPGCVAYRHSSDKADDPYHLFDLSDGTPRRVMVPTLTESQREELGI